MNKPINSKSNFKTQPEERIRSIFRSAPIGIGVVRNRIISEVNDRFCEMTGYSKDELLNKNSSIVYPTKKEFERVGKYKYEQIQKYGIGTIETKLLQKNGNIIDVLLSSTPIDFKDMSKGVTFTATDITKIKQTENSLRESEKKFRTISDNSPDSIIIHDLDMNIIDVNKKAVKEFGYSKAELLKKNVFELHHESELKKSEKVLNAINKKDRVEVETEFIRKDGSVFFAEAIPSKYKLGNKLIIHVIIRDITKRKQAKELLLETNKSLEMMGHTISSMNECVSITDSEHKITFVNDAFIDLYEYKKEEIIGKTAKILQKDIDPKLVDEIRKNAKMGGWRGELVNQKKDGTFVPIELSVTPLKDKSGKIIAHIGITTDITERKKTEKYLKLLNKDQSTLLDISKSLTTSLDMDIVLQNISDRSTNLVGLDTGAIYLIKGDELYLGAATPKISKDFPKVFRRTTISEHPNIQIAISSRKPHILPDLSQANLSRAERAIRESRDMRTLIYVPLMIKEKIFGVLILGTIKKTRTFSKHEINLYITLSHLAALSIENTRLYNKTKQNIVKLKKRILERKKAEDDLKKSEEKYRKFFMEDLSGDYISTYEGRIIDCNPQFLKILGFKSLKQAQNYDVSKLYKSKSEREELLKKLEKKKVLLGEVSETYKVNGAKISIQENISGEFDDDGKLLYIRGYLLDITERKRAEEKLKNRNKELEIFYEAAVNREINMIDLKKEINELLVGKGEKPKYKIID